MKDYLGNPGCLGRLVALLLLAGAIAVVAVISSTDGQTPSGGSGALPAGLFPPAPTSAPPSTRPATIGCTDATDISSPGPGR